MSLYLKKTFYFDSQPPLGKQLIAIVGWIVGYDGNQVFNGIGAGRILAKDSSLGRSSNESSCSIEDFDLSQIETEHFKLTRLLSPQITWTPYHSKR